MLTQASDTGRLQTVNREEAVVKTGSRFLFYNLLLVRTGDKGLKLKMVNVWGKTSMKEYLLQGREVPIEQQRKDR